MQLYKNNCYRCGKERIVLRVWKEKIGNSIVETTEKACPDKECQKIINKEMKKITTVRQEREVRKNEAIKKRRLDKESSFSKRKKI